MVIDDLVILGRSVPEPLKDGRKTVCLGGYSDKHGYIRIYPTRTNFPIKRWDVIAVDVERNSRDTRFESWKIAGSHKQWDRLGDNVNVVGRITDNNLRLDLIDNICVDSIKSLNSKKRSLGVLCPSSSPNLYVRENKKFDAMTQLMLPILDDGIKTKRDYPLDIRLKFQCSGSNHDLMLVEWGCYEYMRKSNDNLSTIQKRLSNNLRLTNDDYLHFVFVGNLVRFRNSFMAISLFRIKKQKQKNMFGWG